MTNICYIFCIEINIVILGLVYDMYIVNFSLNGSYNIRYFPFYLNSPQHSVIPLMCHQIHISKLF